MELAKCTATFKLSGVKKALKFFVFADLHATENMREEGVFEALVRAAKKSQPNSIFFLGDLVHTIQYLDNRDDFEALKNFLDKMAEVAPLYIITGNHDVRSYNAETDRAFVEEPTEFWKAVAKNPQIKILRNAEIETDDFYVAGMEQSPECYGLNREGGTNRYQRNILFGEKPEAMRGELRDFLDSIHVPENTDKPRILLLHSARFLGRRNMRKWVKDFDIIMSGHLHNLAVPPKAFRGAMKAYGLSRKKGHFVCPPVSVFVNRKYQKRYKRYYGIVKIVPKEEK